MIVLVDKWENVLAATEGAHETNKDLFFISINGSESFGLSTEDQLRLGIALLNNAKKQNRS